MQILHFSFLVSFLITCSAGKAPVYTGKDKAAIDKLRGAVSSKLVAKYMKSDAYLYKWLKAKNFDHAQAKEALEKTLEWRKAENIDNLPEEDVGAAAKQYVVDFTTTRDISGLPVMLLPFGDWDVRRKALEGKVNDLGRRLDLMEEKGAQLAFNLTGDPTAMLISDLNGFSLRKHGCAGCVPFYLNWVRHHELHYPYNLYKVLCINTPAIFDPILSLMRPLMTDSTRTAFRTMGHNRAEWSAFIAETVDLTTLPPRFGGTKRKA